MKIPRRSVADRLDYEPRSSIAGNTNFEFSIDVTLYLTAGFGPDFERGRDDTEGRC